MEKVNHFRRMDHVMGNDELSATTLAEITPHLGQTYSSRSGEAFAGNRDAQREIIQSCRDYLLFIANQELDARLHAKCGPSDVVQNTLVKAVEHFECFPGQNQQALLAWLRRILINEIVDVPRAFLGAD